MQTICCSLCLIHTFHLMKEFEGYGALSNLKIHFTKSEAMGVALPQLERGIIQPNFKFKWVTSALRYLGTYIPSNLGNTFAVNFPPLFNAVRSLLDKWNQGLHSWFGRCNIIKMSIMPKFLYLFQALPIVIPAVFFRQIRTLFTKFIWANKRPRISRCLLTLPKCFGGVAAPDAFKYYQAAHLGRMIDWSRHREFKLWIDIEQQSSPIPLGRAPWCYAALPVPLKTHPIIGPTLRMGSGLCRNSNFSTTQSPLFPILGNPSFPPGMELGAFKNLIERSCFQASHFLDHENWPTVATLTQPGGRYEINLWQALQLRHFLRS